MKGTIITSILAFLVGLTAFSQDSLGLNKTIDEVVHLYENDDCMELIDFLFNEEQREFVLIFKSYHRDDCEGELVTREDTWAFNIWQRAFLIQKKQMTQGSWSKNDWRPLEEYTTNHRYVKTNDGVYIKELEFGSVVAGYGEKEGDSSVFVHEEFDEHGWKWYGAPAGFWQYLRDKGDTNQRDQKGLPLLPKDPINVKLYF